MEHRPWLEGASLNPRWWDGELESLARPSILLVEDDPDIRQLLVTLLRGAGFDTVSCGSAEQGLEHLREQSFDLVLTDYTLPNRSGGWLLEEAEAEGLLEATPAMIVTARSGPLDAQGFEVICKPFDLDELVERVRLRVEGAPAPRRVSRARPPGNDSGRGDDDECGDPIELILYVSAHSPRSANAIANIKAALARFRSSRVKLTICDLSREPAKGEADNVAFTPTLVKRSPGPRTFILGHITAPELLLELLEGCVES